MCDCETCPHCFTGTAECRSLRTEIQQGIESGDALPAEDVFVELNARYAEPGRPAGKSGFKRRA